MKEANTVTIVVARAQSPEPKPEVSNTARHCSSSPFLSHDHKLSCINFIIFFNGCCPTLQEKENTTDYKDDIKALTLQIQNLVTKVSEMQSDLKKKDDKIKTLKKMVKKSGLDSKGKIFQSVQVLV